MTMNKSILQAVIDKHGQAMQEDIAIEEMSELIKALIKYRRYHTKQTVDNVREEIADVKIMLTQLEMIWGNVDEIVEFKLDRERQRLEE